MSPSSVPSLFLMLLLVLATLLPTLFFDLFLLCSQMQLSCSMMKRDAFLGNPLRAFFVSPTMYGLISEFQFCIFGSCACVCVWKEWKNG